MFSSWFSFKKFFFQEKKIKSWIFLRHHLHWVQSLKWEMKLIILASDTCVTFFTCSKYIKFIKWHTHFTCISSSPTHQIYKNFSFGVNTYGFSSKTLILLIPPIEYNAWATLQNWGNTLQKWASLPYLLPRPRLNLINRYLKHYRIKPYIM